MLKIAKGKTKYLSLVIALSLVSLIIAVILIALSGTVAYKDNAPPRNGMLDISGWNPQTGNVSLNGEWEFYFNRLLTKQESGTGSIHPDIIANVPSTWNTYEIDNQALPREGYGTYRLRVVSGLKAGDILALDLQGFPSAYTLFIDDKAVASSGHVSTSAETEEASLDSQTVVFAVPAPTFDIIIQISNYHFSRGGLWSGIYMGDSFHIGNYVMLQASKMTFLLGGLVILFLLYFSYFVYRKDSKQSLYFSLICIVTAIAGDLSTLNFTGRMIPGLPFDLYIRIWYVAACLIPLFLILFILEVFPVIRSKVIPYIYMAGTALFILMYLILPTDISTRFVTANQYFAIAGIVTTVVIAILAVRHQYKGAIPYLSGLFVLLLTYIYDSLLYHTNIADIHIGDLLPLGVLAMVCVQSLVLMGQFRSLQEKREQSIQKAAAAELAFLQAQIKPHFIHNALNTIISISRNEPERARILLVNFSLYLRNCFDFKNRNEEVPIEQELNFVKSYITIEQARFGDRLEVEYDIDDVTFTLPPLILQPLAENAIKHGLRPKPCGGKVIIYVKKQRDGITLGVRDNGIGIPKEKQSELLNQNQGGSHTGIYNINQRLKSLYSTSLIIQSEKGKGCDIFMLLPSKEMPNT
jgi:two-component system, LytTR family, sensor kinase